MYIAIHVILPMQLTNSLKPLSGITKSETNLMHALLEFSVIVCGTCCIPPQ